MSMHSVMWMLLPVLTAHDNSYLSLLWVRFLLLVHYPGLFSVLSSSPVAGVVEDLGLHVSPVIYIMLTPYLFHSIGSYHDLAKSAPL